MPDRFGAEVRSKIMWSIKSKNTSPELKVRSYLFLNGFRFRLYPKGVPHRPDIVLRKYKTVIFVHGCFWHQHPGCRHKHIPKSNRYYWGPKLRRNVERDKSNRASLEKLGWRVLTLWECEINQERLIALPALIRGGSCVTS